MNIYDGIIIAAWLSFAAYWGMSATSAKRNIGGRGKLLTGVAVRLRVFVLVVIALRVPIVTNALRAADARVPVSAPMRIVGAAFCALGIALAIYARVHLGRNWGMPMSQKENPELVTNGPYAFIRHPIYTGVLFAMFGTALCMSVAWLVLVIPFGVYFIYSATREEKLMIEEFPEQYPAYMRRTNMLLPFVL